MSETSSISSSGTGTVEYKVIKRLYRELSNAIQYDLQGISDHLWSCDNMITEQNYQYFANKCIPECERAGKLVQVVLNRIKLDSGHYYDFIEVLEKNKEYYSSIFKKIHEYSHDDSLQRRPSFSKSQHHSDEESQSAFLQVPYEDEPFPEYGQVKSRPRYPSVKEEGCFNSDCCCFTFVVFVASGTVYLLYLLFFNVISFLLLLFPVIPSIAVVAMVIWCCRKHCRNIYNIFVCISAVFFISALLGFVIILSLLYQR